MKATILSIIGFIAYFLLSWIIKDIWFSYNEHETLKDVLEIEMFSATITTMFICFTLSWIISEAIEMGFALLIISGLFSGILAKLIIEEVIPLSEGITILFTIANLIMIIGTPWVSKKEQ